MIRIAIQRGLVETFLDMDSDDEFTIEVENPFLNDDLLPTPFSTAISFPMTPLNCHVFQYVNAMKFEPGVKTINVKLYVDGFQFASGMLEFDNVSEGRLNYTFTENSSNINWDSALNDSFSMTRSQILASMDQLQTLPICFPMIINEGQQSKVMWPVAFPITGAEKTTAYEKYRNFRGYDENGEATNSSNCILLPVYRFSALLSQKDAQISYDSEISSLMGQLALIGCGKTAPLPEVAETVVFDQSYEPDIKYKDLLEAVCDITCSCVLFKNGVTKIVSFNSVYAKSPKTIIKIIDENFSISVEKGKKYLCGYKNDGDEVREATDSEKSTSVQEYVDLPAGTSQPAEGVYYITDSKDVISSLFYWYISLGGNHDVDQVWEIADIIAHSIKQIEVTSDNDEQYDATCNMNLVKCVPDWVDTYSGGSGRHGDISVTQYKVDRALRPIVPAQNDDDRSSDCKIGLIKGKQMVDKGIMLQKQSQFVYNDVDDGISLAPEDIYSSYHSNFANFIKKDKILIKLHAHMSISELLSIDITDKLNYRGRSWLIKKMTYTFQTMNGLTDCELELLEM